MLRLESVEPSTLELLRSIQRQPEMADVRLVGGTALAMQFGHRISVDLDLFGEWDRSVVLDEIFSRIGRVVRTGGAQDSKLQFFEVNGVKVDCVAYDRYPWLEEPISEEGVRIAGIADIAAMKVNAIVNRGTRKDFIDMAWILRIHSLDVVMDWFLKKYEGSNVALAVRSLVYFADAEVEPMPQMLQPFDWEEAKDEIRTAVRSLFKYPTI